ncbi:Zinc finger CCCH domain-containing protein 1 [Zostera marina]|uniref:Zinc finger CCCH domain-containing protein 1 n=1 Tax=Zostera marina TaxID=29655 RepID=A0A0K9PWK0_ZOSMR|nr:Zinc finger CCCH domain-containing protein 1 [Zostera marina]
MSADDQYPQSTEPVCNFFRKPTRNKNIRKRQTETDRDDDEVEKNEKQKLKTKKVVSSSALHFSSSNPQTSRTSHKNYGEDDNNTDVSAVFHFESSKEIQVENDSKATASLQTETEFDRDSRALREKVLKKAGDALKRSGEASNSATNTSTKQLYSGIHGYTDYKAGFRREQTVASEKAGGSHGPLRTSAHIRASVRFDYQPDICKDYKETGYCGFGDSCKFMHDRGDYKSGWQMEKEWEEKEKLRKRALAMGEKEDDEDDDEDDDELPFACFICRQPFVDPVVTKCKHYFCEHCALKHHSKNKKCFVCNKPTLGMFNTAHEIKKRITADKK